MVESGWEKTYPNVDGHHVVVGGMTKADDTNPLAQFLSAIIPTAYAAVMPTTYGPFNFGNVFHGNNSYSQGSYGGGGGNGKKVELHKGNGGGSTTPAPQVLGAEAPEPVGAPNTGAGGASPISLGIHGFIAILPTRKGVRARHAN
jgi:hypothetical protein